MSKNLYWREATPPPERLGSAALPLRRLIAHMYYDHDGSLISEPVVVEADAHIVTYLEGFLAGHDDEEVRKFLADLREHKRLEVWIDE
jgi:hypothetical protein